MVNAALTSNCSYGMLPTAFFDFAGIKCQIKTANGLQRCLDLSSQVTSNVFRSEITNGCREKYLKSIFHFIYKACL